MDDLLDADGLDPPERPDFRRVNKGVPFVVGLEGKRVRYGRSSNAGKILDDESNLTDWKLRTVVAGAAQRPELMAKASVLDVDTNKKELRDIAEECLVAGKGQRRSIIGSAVHAMFDHIDRNDNWIPPPQFNELCDAYEAMLEDWGLEVLDIEVPCINHEFRVAGTLDRRYRTTRTLVAPDGTVIPIGTVIVGDTKTGKELEYASGSYATQLAAYVDSMRYDLDTDESYEWEPSSLKEWALIIHANSSGTTVDVYWVDLKAGRLGLALAREVKAWRQRDDLLTIGRRLRTVPEPLAPSEPPTSPVDESRAISRAEHLRSRVRAITGHGDVAAFALQRGWPVGIPGLKQDGHSMDQLDQIEAAIMKVEKEHSLPFHTPWEDPSIDQVKSNHPSDAWAWRRNAPPPDERQRNTIQQGLMNHKRAALLRSWVGMAVAGGVNHEFDTFALAHALFEFASVDESVWPDDELTTMLDGSLRAMGYVNGTNDLGKFNPDHAPILMSAAFAIAAGNAVLLFNENDQPIVRTNVKEPT